MKIKTEILKIAGQNCSSHGSVQQLIWEISGLVETFKFNTVKFVILGLRKHKRITNKIYNWWKRLNVSVLNWESHLPEWKWLLCCWSTVFIHELNLRVYCRPANDTLHRLLLVKSMGVCEKDCSSKALLCNFSFLFSNLFFFRPN